MKLALLLGLCGVAHAELRKAHVRPALKTIHPRTTSCYGNSQLSGVVNTKLTVHSDERGIRLSVDGFDTHGAIGESRDFLACLTKELQSVVLPAIAAHGTLSVIYPSTFAPTPPDNHDRAIVGKAARALQAKRWRDALTLAERGLESTSLDGTFRRRLVEIAGSAACRIGDDAKTQNYMLLASQDAEDRIRRACSL
jgi:hypothetical protein